MSREAAEYLSTLLSSNTTLKRVNLDLNQVPPGLVTDITKACRRNRDICKQTSLPKVKKELDRLLELTGNGEECTYEKRTAF